MQMNDLTSTATKMTNTSIYPKTYKLDFHEPLK